MMNLDYRLEQEDIAIGILYMVHDPALVDMAKYLANVNGLSGVSCRATIRNNLVLTIIVTLSSSNIDDTRGCRLLWGHFVRSSRFGMTQQPTCRLIFTNLLTH